VYPGVIESGTTPTKSLARPTRKKTSAAGELPADPEPVEQQTNEVTAPNYMDYRLWQLEQQLEKVQQLLQEQTLRNVALEEELAENRSGSKVSSDTRKRPKVSKRKGKKNPLRKDLGLVEPRAKSVVNKTNPLATPSVETSSADRTETTRDTVKPLVLKKVRESYSHQNQKVLALKPRTKKHKKSERTTAI
jgi:hypothetical protein